MIDWHKSEWEGFPLVDELVEDLRSKNLTYDQLLRLAATLRIEVDHVSFVQGDIIEARNRVEEERERVILQLNREKKYHARQQINEGKKQQKTAQARSGAEAKLANDPKQAAKQYVQSCWQVWQEEPDRYGGKADFARSMLKLKQCESLTSQKKIEDWCREWEKETSPS